MVHNHALPTCLMIVSLDKITNGIHPIMNMHTFVSSMNCSIFFNQYPLIFRSKILLMYLWKKMYFSKNAHFRIKNTSLGTQTYSLRYGKCRFPWLAGNLRYEAQIWCPCWCIYIYYYALKIEDEQFHLFNNHVMHNLKQSTNLNVCDYSIKVQYSKLSKICCNSCDKIIQIENFGRLSNCTAMMADKLQFTVVLYF